MTVTAEIGTGQLAQLVEQMLAGNEVLLTRDDKPVAKLVPASSFGQSPRGVLRVHSLPGHQVLTTNIPQEELAEELFRRQ